MTRPSWSLIGGFALMAVAAFGVAHEVRNAVVTYDEYRDGAARQRSTMELLEPIEKPSDFDVVLGLGDGSAVEGIATASTPAKPLTALTADEITHLREMAARFNALPADRQQKLRANVRQWAAMTPFRREAARLDFLRAHAAPHAPSN